jgi:hypothetical protein
MVTLQKYGVCKLSYQHRLDPVIEILETDDRRVLSLDNANIRAGVI